jgi:hypothetical protein
VETVDDDNLEADREIITKIKETNRNTSSHNRALSTIKESENESILNSIKRHK